MKVYFISGLGADCRIFTHIRLPEGFEKVDLNWISPKKDESLSDYSMRMSENINTSEKFVLIGLSMGGMIASEIAGKYSPAATILVSSVPSSSELPKMYKAMNSLQLHRLLPISVIKSATILKRLFTAERKEDKSLLRRIIRDTDPQFIRWGLNAIPQWKYTSDQSGFCHIHGGKDAILPIKYTKPTHTIASGTHMLILTNAEEVNKILEETLLQIK